MDNKGNTSTPLDPSKSASPKIKFLPQPTTEIILKPRTIPICATEERFCSVINGQLTLKKSGKRSIEYTCTSLDFTFEVTIPANKWKFIFEEKVLSCNTMDGQASRFFLRRKLLTVSDQYVLLKQSDRPQASAAGTATTSTSSVGNKPKHLELCRFTNCSVPTRNKGKIIAEFVDLTANSKVAKRMLMLKGDLGMNDLIIYLGDPKKEGERVVARIRKLKIGTPQKKETSESYRLDFAGGVDITVLVGLFVVLDDVRVKNPPMKNIPALLK